MYEYPNKQHAVGSEQRKSQIYLGILFAFDDLNGQNLLDNKIFRRLNNVFATIWLNLFIISICLQNRDCVQASVALFFLFKCLKLTQTIELSINFFTFNFPFNYNLTNN